MMKNRFLKIAKVKDEASFYKKYPSEAAFFKAHPEAKKLIKKAQVGTQIPTVQLTDAEVNNPGKQQWGSYLAAPTPPMSPLMGALPGAISSIGTGIGKIKDAKKQLKSLDQQAQVTGVQAQAATSRDIDAPNVMARNIKKQRDAMFQPTDPNTLFPTYGVGTNVLAKNGTEIQNTFAPNTIYTDAAYEPLDDSNIKQYDFGGPIPIAQNGFSNFMTGGGGDAISGMLGDVTGNTGEGDIGSGIGSLAGTALGGPLGGMLGGLAGKAIGSLFGQKRANQMKQFGNQIQTNQATMQGAALSNNLQSQYGGSMENGGNLTNPQLITKFGEYDVKDLFYPDPTMDTLRVGGNLRSFTPPSEHGLQEYAMGGDLQTHWGGHAETMSQNPYLPASGETVMFRGQSHDESDNNGRTGIGITYGDSPVEVERGEPAVKLENGGEENLTVFGNLYIPKTHLDVIGDPNAKNKKFKTYVADLSNKEAKQNKIIDKSSEAINTNKVFSPIDQLTFNSHSAMLKGADSKLKNYAEFKQNAAMLQNAINDTAEEHGILADDLAKGKYTIDKKAMKEQAKYGKELFKAQNGDWINKMLDYESTQGSASGQGLTDFGIKREKWEKKYPEIWKDGKVDREEAEKFIKKEYLPQVKDYPEDVQKRLVDYMYNTGRNANDLLLNATGNLDLNTMQTKSSDEDLWKKNKQKIIEQTQDPNFGNQLDAAKANVMKDFWTRKGTPEVYDKTSKDRIFMWDKPQQTSSQDPQQLSYDAQGSLTATPPAPAQQNNIQASGFQGPGSGVLRPYIDPQTAQNDPQTPIDYSFGVPGANATSFSQDVSSNHYSDLTPDEVKELNDLYTKASAFKGKGSNPIVKQFQRRFHELLPNLALNISQNDPHGVTTAGRKKGLTKEDLFQGSNTADVLAKNNEEGIFGDRTEQYKAALDKLKTPPPGEMMKGFKSKEQSTSSSTDKSNTSVEAIPAKKRNTFLDIASQIAPYLTPSFKNPLDANQLYGENYALGRNKVEPVQANLYNPLLETPYDISLQDQLNANQGDFNAIQRMTGNNPAALSALAGQKYGANSKVLADQFRMNQAEKAGVYGRNRQSLNDAQLKNLGIMDQQYVRQSQAKSNAEALTQSALNSMSDKIQKNKLETMGYNVYANKFPGYTFTSEGRLIKNPSFQQFEIPTVGSTASGRGKQTAPEGFEYLYDDEGNVKKMQNKAKEKTARNGSLVKAFKNI